MILKSILAGIAIAIGGTAYMVTGFPWIFPIGLFIICFYGLNLFTGKICYIQSAEDMPCILLVYLCNTIAAYVSGLVIRFAKPSLIEKAQEMADAKLAEGLRLIPLAILCNVLIFVAVDTFRQSGKFLGLIFATTVFVACGFEHCIANAFYFGICAENLKTICPYLLTNAVFNGFGGILAMRLFSRGRPG